MKERFDQHLSGIMPLNAMGQPQTISEYLVREREMDVMQLRLSKAYVLTLPALLLYILFSIFRPDFVFGGVKKVDVQAVIQKNPSCAEGFSSMEINADQIISVPLQPLEEVQTVDIKEIDPERQVNIKLIGRSNQPEKLAIHAGYRVVRIEVDCK